MSNVKSAERTLLVIELLTEHEDGLTFVQIVNELGLPKSSAHALVKTMSERGHLTLDENTRRYRIGLRLWEAGQAYERIFDLPNLAQPHLIRARDDLDETLQLAVLDGLENVYIAKAEADQRLVLASSVGMRLPAYATGLGKVLLAGLDDDELIKRLEGLPLRAFTANTITTTNELIEAVRQTRERGYGLDLGEYTDGVRCVAVPIFDRAGTTVAAMSVSIPEIRLVDGNTDRIVAVLLKHAEALSVALGWQDPQAR